VRGLLPVRRGARAWQELTLTGLVCGAAGVDARRGEEILASQSAVGRVSHAGRAPCLHWASRRRSESGDCVLLDAAAFTSLGARFEGAHYSIRPIIWINRNGRGLYWWRGECLRSGIAAGRGRTALQRNDCVLPNCTRMATGQPQACRDFRGIWVERVG
jgi:hypothetical protein